MNRDICKKERREERNERENLDERFYFCVFK